MRILHTSDWHLGRTLYGKRRYKEFSAFLDWLLETIAANSVEVLLVAGDIFDTSTPGTTSQQLYYRFLSEVAKSCCRDVIITAGNHDSPTFLDAPHDLLNAFDVHVIGTAREDVTEEVLTLHDEAGVPHLIVCAVPYLRDRDIRRSVQGESIDEKDTKLINGVKAHYDAVCDHAEVLQQDFKENGYGKIPIIAMGHLFAAGGKTFDGDGVRELYIGSLAHIGSDLFHDSIDYLALGHLHIPQKLNGIETMRYSGSPIPVGFGEATQKKRVILLGLTPQEVKIEELFVPCFQRLVQLQGDYGEITEELEKLKAEDMSIWVEIDYTGSEILHDLKGQLEQTITDSPIEILRIRNRQIVERALKATVENESLEDLDEYQVFSRFMDDQGIVEESRTELLAAYGEIITAIQEKDSPED